MIFEEPTGRRRRKVRVCFLLAGLACATLACISVLNVVVTPRLPHLPQLIGQHRAGVPTISEPLTRSDASKASFPIGPGAASAESAVVSATDPSVFGSPFVRCAFVVQDDPDSTQDLLDHLSGLQVVFPDWFTFTSGDGNIRTDVKDSLRAPLAASGVMVFPRISNTDSNGNWRSGQLHELFTNSDSSDIFLDQLIPGLQKLKARGVNIDIEGIDTRQKQEFVDWLDKVAAALHEKKLAITVDVPAYDDAFDYEAIGNIADAVVLMAYDQHYSTGKAGPIAAKSWFNDCVDDATRRIDPGKLIVGMGAYGYDWRAGSRNANALSFSDAMLLAAQNGAEIEAAADSVNSHFKYQDDEGAAHEVWLLDAVSCWNQYLTACQGRARGVALWRCGLEEPAIWKFYGRDASADFRPQRLAEVEAPASVNFDGEGELLTVKAKAGPGRRYMTFDGEGIDYANYSTLPSPFSVQRFGRGDKDEIALTFDDGPDPKWTPEILDVLKENGVRATFFVVGQQAGRFPEIVSDEFAAGDLLGNHTYSHPDLRKLSNFWLHIELNSTQRLIESITHHHTILFRAPYDTDTEPTSADELAPLYEVNESGYVAVGANVDSDDYDRPGVAQIVHNVLSGLASGQSNVVVFHDAGGDRSQTVEALRQLIPVLRGKGYEFVGIDKLMGEPADLVMPAVGNSEHVLVYGNTFLMTLRIWSWRAVVGLFAVTTAISILRILGLGVLAIRKLRRASPAPRDDFEPAVRVLIPAFNEAKVIERTIDSVLASDYANLPVTVIDDGSADETAEVVRAYALRDERVSLIEQANSGKAEALNNGLAAATEEIVVTIDADTIIMPQTVREMAQCFADPSVDAVCGNVQVGNVHSVLTAFQNVEYITSQNYDRRAFDHLNCISVVPGATGAWRREKVLAIGGYSDQTLTEDADLTLSLLSAGGRVVYAPNAISITEAPETVRTLFRQRFRWSFGTLQCLWKHRAQAFRGSLGWIALPNIFFFQLLFPLLSPLGDAILLMCLVRHDFSAIAVGYCLFLVMDLLGSSIALHLDHRRLVDVWVVFIQRFYYRQFMYVVTFAAVLGVLGGRRHAWNKLHRTGSVRQRLAGVGPMRQEGRPLLASVF
jgi:cellulose synthase/poly-beta-1,6-N-acetylglucosamine synthase-like glycosyltransferase/peptidoglycan/xylan/chitin deacetylase (PgdA/CDA1 family)/spore germination protein YaaH